MKKVSAILLFTIYSLTTLGIGIRQFYCCGKLKSTSITLVQDAKEKCTNSNAMKGCCKTQFKSVKAKDSHVAADAITVLVKHFTDWHTTTPSYEINVSVYEPLVVANTSNAPPPKLHGVATYILNCTYRI